MDTCWIVEDAYGPLMVGEQKEGVLGSFSDRILWERHAYLGDRANTIINRLRESTDWVECMPEKFRLREWIPKR